MVSHWHSLFVFGPEICMGARQDINKDKTSLCGVAFGYFTGSLGGAFYASHDVNESLSWGLSADYIGSFSDFALIASSDDEDKEYLFLEPKLSIGVTYKI